MHTLRDRLCLVGDATGFRADTKAYGTPITFGGQLFGLAIMAASSDSPRDLRPTALYAQLLAAGKSEHAVDVHAKGVHEGRTSSVSEVKISQGEAVIARVTVSFGVPSASSAHEHHLATPRVGGPEIEDDSSSFISRWRFDELEFRHPVSEAGRRALHPVWVRPVAPIGDDVATNAAAAAFLSDLGLVLEAAKGIDLRTTYPVTVDHAIWFHGAPRVDDWLLLDAQLMVRESDYALVSAHLFDRTFGVVATIIQMVRYRKSPGHPNAAAGFRENERTDLRPQCESTT